METIRVLHVLGRLDRGGAETMVMNLYRHVNRELVQFDFVIHTEEECDYSREIREMGGKIYSVPAFHGVDTLSYRKAWRELLHKHPEYKILHSHVRSSASLYIPIAKKYGMQTIIHAHNTSSGTGISSVVKGILQYPLRYQGNYLFACGRMAGEWLFGKKACLKSNFIILKNAIDLEQFEGNIEIRQAVREKQHAQHRFVVGHVGRFEDQKNHPFLLEVFEKVCELEPGAQLWLIGTGRNEADIRKLAVKKGIEDSVQFLGNRENVNEWMQGMDFFLFPSKFEGLPVTLIEAQASGLPILCSTQITEEVCVTDGIERMSLEEEPGRWAEKIVSMQKKQPKASGIIKIKAAGYSIVDTSRWLEEFYRKL